MSLFRRKPRVFEATNYDSPYMQYVYLAFVDILSRAPHQTVTIQNFRRWDGSKPEVTMRLEPDGSLTVMLVQEENRDL